MHQLESIYISPFKKSYPCPIHTCFPIIASNYQYNKTSIQESVSLSIYPCMLNDITQTLNSKEPEWGEKN